MGFGAHTASNAVTTPKLSRAGQAAFYPEWQSAKQEHRRPGNDDDDDDEEKEDCYSARETGPNAFLGGRRGKKEE